MIRWSLALCAFLVVASALLYFFIMLALGLAIDDAYPSGAAGRLFTAAWLAAPPLMGLASAVAANLWLRRVQNAGGSAEIAVALWATLVCAVFGAVFLAVALEIDFGISSVWLAAVAAAFFASAAVAAHVSLVLKRHRMLECERRGQEWSCAGER